MKIYRQTPLRDHELRLCTNKILCRDDIEYVEINRKRPGHLKLIAADTTSPESDRPARYYVELSIEEAIIAFMSIPSDQVREPAKAILAEIEAMAPDECPSNQNRPCNIADAMSGILELVRVAVGRTGSQQPDEA